MFNHKNYIQPNILEAKLKEILKPSIFEISINKNLSIIKSVYPDSENSENNQFVYILKIKNINNGFEYKENFYKQMGNVVDVDEFVVEIIESLKFEKKLF